MELISRPQRPALSSRPVFLGIQLLVSGAALAALFFLLTNAIPLVQLGILQDVSKKFTFKAVRISLIFFSALTAVSWWRLSASDFEKLWPVAAVKKILQAPWWAVLLF